MNIAVRSKLVCGRARFIFSVMMAALFSVLIMAGCGNNPADSDNDDNRFGNDDKPDKSVWLISKSKQYIVTDGIVGNVSSETNYTWISYTDDKHYEQEVNSTIPLNAYTEYDTYIASTVGSIQVSTSTSRNGNTSHSVSHTVHDITTTLDYVDSAREDYITRMTSDITQTMTIVYDEASGLTLSQSITSTGTTNGEPVNGSSETRYTLALLSTNGDVKTYRVTATEGAYLEYKIQNGITLEQKSYTADGTLSYAMTYTFPDNEIIRAKLPEYTFGSGGSTGITCELVSDSATELTISIKTYTAGVLTTQQDSVYKKR